MNEARVYRAETLKRGGCNTCHTESHFVWVIDGAGVEFRLCDHCMGNVMRSTSSPPALHGQLYQADRWMRLFPVGAKVMATDPDGFKAEVASKLRNRVGTVMRHQPLSGAPIVVFPKERRRGVFQWVPPRETDLYVLLGDVGG